MTSNPVISRRTALAVGAAGVGTVTLAACGSSSSAAKTSKAASSAAAGATVATLDDIKVGEAISATLPDGSKVLVARPTATTAACFSAICTHQGCTVAPAGKQLHCPCHGSVYNAETGAVIHGPAPRALPAVPVHVVNGAVVTGA